MKKKKRKSKPKLVATQGSADFVSYPRLTDERFSSILQSNTVSSVLSSVRFGDGEREKLIELLKLTVGLLK